MGGSRIRHGLGLFLVLAAGALFQPTGGRAEQSGDWTFTLKPKGESSSALSETVDGATIRFECDGDWIRPTFNIEAKRYPVELILADRIFLYVSNLQEASIFPGIPLEKGHGQPGQWTLFPPYELKVVGRWAAAPESIVVALTAGMNQPLLAKREFSARGSKKALEAVLDQCGLR